MWYKIKNFQEKHFIAFDTFLSGLFIAVLAIILKCLKWEASWLDNVCSQNGLGDFILAMAQTYGTLLGFVIAVGAMIFAFDHSEKIELLKKSRYYPLVLKIYTNSSIYLMLGLLVNVFLFFVDFNNEKISLLLLYLMIWLLAVNLIKIWRCVWVLKKMFNLSRPQ